MKNLLLTAAILFAPMAHAGEFSDFLNGNTLSATVVRGVINQLGAEDARTQNRLSNLSYSELRDLERHNLAAWNARTITQAEYTRAHNNIAKARGQRERAKRQRTIDRGYDPNKCSACGSETSHGLGD